ncbi:MAG: hypothetical protein KGH89_05190 [Thaumarchaeota archaeon]|nr:hypothetical protein [Nitrososphaerota archaeon]
MECTSETCNTKEHATCSCSSEMHGEQCGCDEIDAVHHVMDLWHKAFHDAMHEAQVERLKKRIDANFGPTMDKAADAFIETAGKVFQSVVVKSEAKKELESKLQKILSETSRR